jgi:excisionase family DNA binding protein
LTVEDCVRATTLSRATIYKFIKTGELPSLKVGKRRLVRRQALSAWLARRERQTSEHVFWPDDGACEIELVPTMAIELEPAANGSDLLQRLSAVIDSV